MSDPNYPQAPPTTPMSPWAPPPEQPPPEAPPATRRRPAKLLAIAGGVLALGGGAAFAVQSFGDDETGAATPEEAVSRLFEAVADEDVLGVVDLLPDGEREALRDALTSARDEYQRLDILSDSFSLDGFRGVDITAEELEFDVEEITDGLAMVFLDDGELSVDVDGDELVGNLGGVVDEVADARDADLEVDDVDESTDIGEEGDSFFFIAVVEEEGRWHPSVAFTFASFFTADPFGESSEQPDLDGGIDPEGAGSPEDAVQALLDAAVDLDAEAAIAGLDPGEMRALQVFAPTFIELDDESDEEFELEAELTSAEVDDLGDGASRVVPTGFELHFEDDDGGSADVVLEDGCVTVDVQPPAGEGDPLDEEFCGGDDLPDEIADVEVPDELQDVVDAFQPLRFGIVTVERDGGHFVAPFRTLVDIVLGVTRGLEPDDLDEGGAVFALLSGELDDEVEELMDELFESSFAFEDEGVFDDEIFEDEFENDFEDGECQGIGCGFEDEGSTFERIPTGASGANGELLPFDAVAGSVGLDQVATFTAVADDDGGFLVGAQGADGFDGTITVVDPATGEVLGDNDDFFGVDPEVLIDLEAGQVVTIEIRGFAGDAGDFVVYFEPF